MKCYSETSNETLQAHTHGPSCILSYYFHAVEATARDCLAYLKAYSNTIVILHGVISAGREKYT